MEKNCTPRFSLSLILRWGGANLEQEYIIAEAIRMKSLTSLDLSSNKIDHSALALREYVASSRSAFRLGGHLIFVFCKTRGFWALRVRRGQLFGWMVS